MIGKVPLAAVLWNGGITFGGVESFIFAGRIIIAIIVSYAKYYGRRAAGSWSPNLACRRRKVGGAHQFAVPSRVMVAGTSR